MPLELEPGSCPRCGPSYKVTPEEHKIEEQRRRRHQAKQRLKTGIIKTCVLCKKEGRLSTYGQLEIPKMTEFQCGCSVHNHGKGIAPFNCYGRLMDAIKFGFFCVYFKLYSNSFRFGSCPGCGFSGLKFKPYYLLLIYSFYLAKYVLLIRLHWW